MVFFNTAKIQTIDDKIKDSANIEMLKTALNETLIQLKYCIKSKLVSLMVIIMKA